MRKAFKFRVDQRVRYAGYGLPEHVGKFGHIIDRIPARANDDIYYRVMTDDGCDIGVYERNLESARDE